MFKYVANRISSRHGVERVFRERLAEPMHLNLIALFVAIFGTRRMKIYFDLYARPQFAFGVLRAADEAKQMGISRIKVLEFGTASGAGLLNLSEIATRVGQTTGVDIEVIGFDGAVGLPEPRDYRDHPDLYTVGTFKMPDPDALVRKLPSNARLIRGEIADTLPQFLSECSVEAPIGFVAVDVDYYFSTVDTLGVFAGEPEWYLPATTMYFDDVWHERHNEWCGELLAIREFNDAHDLRKIAPYNQLRGKRVFRNAQWIDKIFMAHVLDHPDRQPNPSTARTASTTAIGADLGWGAPSAVSQCAAGPPGVPTDLLAGALQRDPGGL